MKTIGQKELEEILSKRTKGATLDMSGVYMENIDLSGSDLENIDFSWATFKDVKLDGSNMEKTSIANTLFTDCTLRGTNLRNADMKEANLRYCDLSGAHIEGADLYCSLLEYANLKDIVSNDETKFFRLYCPEKGPFLGYKKCFNDLLVQLLIPADAKRTSATANSCRCNKAKVLTIKSFDYKRSYKEAWSLVNENFVYRVGEYVYVPDFNEDRWMDSTTGIHFWMTREEAKAY
ncbi:MAG: pentapeptide repeat-containing protein [Clostridiaceae bacterium]